MSAAHQHDPWHEFRDLPALLTPKQVLAVLNLETMKAVYRRKENGSLPGVVQISRKRWRVRKAVLLRSLLQGHAPSND
jgi:hypothetical protein